MSQQREVNYSLKMERCRKRQIEDGGVMWVRQCWAPLHKLLRPEGPVLCLLFSVLGKTHMQPICMINQKALQRCRPLKCQLQLGIDHQSIYVSLGWFCACIDLFLYYLSIKITIDGSNPTQQHNGEGRDGVSAFMFLCFQSWFPYMLFSFSCTTY